MSFSDPGNYAALGYAKKAAVWLQECEGQHIKENDETGDR